METGLLKKYDENDKKFVIAKELMRSVNALMVSNRMHIAAATELGIRMFDEWAYDYSCFIEPIRKHFAK